MLRLVQRSHPNISTHSTDKRHSYSSFLDDICTVTALFSIIHSKPDIVNDREVNLMFEELHKHVYDHSIRVETDYHPKTKKHRKKEFSIFKQMQSLIYRHSIRYGKD